jgi:DNA replication protein DnaC
MNMGNFEYERLHENLKTLGMLKTSENLDSYLEIASKQSLSTIQILDQLLNDEVEDKMQRSLNFRSRIAKFPYKKTLEEFDFSFQPSIDRKTINGLASMKFVHNAENVVLLGPPGVGKTHLAIGLGMSAVKNGITVYFTTAADLIDDLKQHSSMGMLKERLRKIARYNLLIVDEIGYLPLDKEGANFLFQLVSMRYERSSLVLTSNKPFKDWGQIFGDDVVASAILDRLLHHCTVVNIKGESYRIKDRKRVGLLQREQTGDQQREE